MLPIELQMQIDLAAHDLKRDIADGFAKLRAELLPEPSLDPARAAALWQQMALANAPYRFGGYNTLWGGPPDYYDHYGLGAAWHAMFP